MAPHPENARPLPRSTGQTPRRFSCRLLPPRAPPLRRAARQHETTETLTLATASSIPHAPLLNAKRISSL